MTGSSNSRIISPVTGHLHIALRAACPERAAIASRTIVSGPQRESQATPQCATRLPRGSRAAATPAHGAWLGGDDPVEAAPQQPGAYRQRYHNDRLILVGVDPRMNLLKAGLGRRR